MAVCEFPALERVPFKLNHTSPSASPMLGEKTTVVLFFLPQRARLSGENCRSPSGHAYWLNM